MRVLIVEDEFPMAKAVRSALQRDRHEVAIAESGAQALTMFASWAPEAILLDLVLPDSDGREIARKIRSQSDVPLIMVSALSDEADRIAGLEIGADDYVTKPFSMPELLARLRAVLRRSKPRSLSAEPLVAGDLVVDPQERRASLAGRELSLTYKEFELLRMLAQRPGGLVRRSEICSAIWGLPSLDASKTLDVHISWLRRKLGDPALVETVRGVGFRLREA